MILAPTFMIMDKSSAKETSNTAPSSVSRKRFERLSKTPQGAQHNKTEAESENADEAESAKATAIEVAAEDNEAAPDRTLSLSPTLSECRRSSRKKIIKFDVRDLLNKNRKTQKIHIEARIDSNAAPAVPESSSRRFAVLEGSSETATTNPANRRKTLTALEVFAKPKVSQVSTEESHQNQQVQVDPPSNDTSSPAPRKRGRPRKAQLVLLHKDVAAVRSYSYSDSDTNSSSNSTNSTTNSSGSESKNKLKNKLRVSLKRINMPASRESTDSGELRLPIRLVDVVSNSSSDSTTNDRPVLRTIDDKHLEPERVDTTDGDEANIETETITLLSADDDDSDSQIIFVEIQNEVGTDESTLTTSNETGTNFKLIFPKEEEQKQLNKEQSEQTLERELIVEVVRETSNLWSADDEEEKTSSPKSFEKRRSKRSTLRGSTLSNNNSSKMTLEETFAEIAAKSSESILKEESTEGAQDLEVEALIDLVEDSNSNSQIGVDAHLSSQLDLESQLQVPANVHQSDVPCVVQLDETLPVETTSGIDNNKLPKAKQELKEQLRKQEAVEETLPTEEVQREVPEMEDLQKEKLQKEKLRKEEQPKKVQQKKKLQKGKLQNIEPENEEKQRELLIKETVQDALQRKELTNEMQNKGELKKENVQTEEVHKKMLLRLKPLKETRLKEKQEKKEVLEEDLQIKEPKMEDIRKDELQKEELNKKVKEDELQPFIDKVAMLQNCLKTPENISTSASEERTPQTTKSQAELEAEADRKLEMTNKAEKQPTSRSSTLTPPPPPSSTSGSNKTKSDKASNVSIVECDAMFKEIDKASAQAKKKSKAITKKQLNCIAQKEPEPHNESPNSLKLNLIKNQVAPAEEQQCEETGKRRSAQHILEAKVKGKQKKVQRKSVNLNQISRRNSLDSSSSALQSSSKRSSAKTSDALQLALTETESSESIGSSDNKIPTCGIPTPTSELEAQDPLNDIAKFIEAGVQLLKRDFKLEEQQQQQQQEQQTSQQTPEDEFAQQVANIETPATTPATTPSSSPQPSSNGADDTSSSTVSCGGGGVRRSHRIKQKPQVPKTNRWSSASQTSSMISMEDQLAELAHIEAINEQFLRQEGLNTFQPLRDNYYRCARQVSQENAEMQCDCFLTGDEEAMGHQCCGAGCINRMLMIECGPMCTSGDRCTNKRFQQHQCWPCRVFRTEKKGCGITAELQIPPGEFIMEYVGEVIDSEEFERRQHLYSRDRNRHYYFMALRGEAIIDATAKGNISRYINHSCDPNAETQKWTVNGELRIGFFSVKTILPGEEITFDYQYQRYGRDAQRCFCEAVNCRGWIGGEPDSDEGEQLNDESGEGESESEVNEELEQEADKLGRLSGKVGKLSSSKQAKQSSSSSTSSKQSKQAIRKQRKEQPKAKDREYKAGRWLRPSGSGGAAAGSGGEKSSSRKPNQLEDPDVLEQLTILNRSGLKNQADTLRFSRCMVRAKLLQTRLQLLGVLTRGELPCRRLFLDYHGVRLLHAWFNESESNNQLRLALLEALESLPIPNRTMLNDSRVYQSVQAWSESAVEAGAEEQVRQRILALLQKWNALPEIFRIPKRERIEQMKEHEREADRQQQPHHGATALEDSNSNSASATLNSDRYRQDRFRRDTSSRYEKHKVQARMSGNNTICTITNAQLKERNGNGDVESVSLGTPGGGGVAGSASNGTSCGMSKADPRRRSELTNDQRTISKELRRSLFARKVSGEVPKLIRDQ